MQINNDLETGGASPADGLVEILQLTIDVLVSIQVLQSPVSHRDSDVVHSCTGDLIQIVGGNETAPVLGQNRATFIRTQSLTERPLIDRRIASGVKNRWSDPGFSYQPTTEVDTPDLVIPVVEV